MGHFKALKGHYSLRDSHEALYSYLSHWHMTAGSYPPYLRQLSFSILVVDRRKRIHNILLRPSPNLVNCLFILPRKFHLFQPLATRVLLWPCPNPTTDFLCQQACHVNRLACHNCNRVILMIKFVVCGSSLQLSLRISYTCSPVGPSVISLCALLVWFSSKERRPCRTLALGLRL